MNLAGKRIWQIAAGDTNRRYQDVLLDWDVVAMGPGDAGWYPEHVSLDAGFSAHQVLALQQFCGQMTAGDIVVLRLGTAEVYGVGEVVGDYLWLDDFGDIDGWDLQHVRRIRWLWKYDGNAAKTFPAYTLKFGGTIQELNRELTNCQPCKGIFKIERRGGDPEDVGPFGRQGDLHLAVEAPRED